MLKPDQMLICKSQSIWKPGSRSLARSQIHYSILLPNVNRGCRRPCSQRFTTLSPQGPLSHILMMGGVRQRFIFYTPKNPNFRICLPKKIHTFFSIPQKNPSVFLHQQILLFIFWKAKTCQLQLWFWSKTKL